ncbi:spermidine/putrescine-binding protein [Kushneria sinocarnis]|uniref:Putrescine-binding periplasmic protein n=1 Tax=Kushneria sinocarnis TaxID=595502 RepID=A0A420WVI3_9GAMM|nr:spermidine/putrescine-binding protein [Kushneria sinocarnis]
MGMANMRNAVLLTLGLGSALAAGTTPAAEQKLYLFNWTQYMDPEIISEFEQRHDVDVVQSYFGSLAEMYAKLQAGGDSQYDVIVPSNYFIPRLIDSGLVQKLDRSQIPNLDHVMSRFQNPAYDPQAQYSVPYQWGTTGIVYNTETFPDAPQSWSLLFDPDVNASQPFSMMTDGQVMLGAACAWQGNDYNCANREAWVEAAKLLLDTKGRRNFTGFVDGTPVLQQLERGVSQVGLTYNGDYLLNRSENPEAYEHLDFMLPKEGSELWVDAMMIPARAPHPELAHEFINFILEAQIGARLSNYNRYSTPNKAAVPYLDEELQGPPAQPSKEQMARLQFTPSLDGQQLQTFQQLWNEVKSR